MKFASLIFFTVALVWTWSLVHSSSPVSFKTHADIQEQLAQYLDQLVKKKQPNATDFVVDKIWTEAEGDDKVRAYFKYSFKAPTEDSGNVNNQIEGRATLVRQGLDEEGRDRWVVEQPTFTSDSVQFDEPTVVTASPDGTTQDSETESDAGEQTGPSHDASGASAAGASASGNSSAAPSTPGSPELAPAPQKEEHK